MTTAAMDPSQVQRILEARARELSREPEADARGDTVELVVLALGPERYGVAGQLVQAIHPLSGLTSVPGLPAFWAGLVNLRGRLYPVLNLRRYLGLAGDRKSVG